MSLPLKRIGVLVLGAVFALTVVGCHGIKPSVDNAKLTQGPRFDQTGKLTDSPEVSMPIWSSKGLKEKPQDITPTPR